jgi:hypothetical protein
MKVIWITAGATVLGGFAMASCLFAQTTNSATASSPSSGSTNAAPALASTLFGNVSFAAQPSAEVSTLGYELTSDEANRIAHTVYHSLMSSSYEPPSTNRKSPREAQKIDLIIVNQKRSALLTVQYELVKPQLQEVIEQSKQVQHIFQIASMAQGPITFDTSDPSDGDLKAVYLQIVQVLKNKNYDPTNFFPKTNAQQTFTSAQEQLSNIPQLVDKFNAAKKETTEAENEWSLFHSDRDKTIKDKQTKQGEAQQKVQSAVRNAFATANAFYMENGLVAPAAIQAPVSLDSAPTAATAANSALNSTPPSTSSISAITRYAVPYIGQVQAAVDSLTSLGQSVAQFVSLFRQNQVINGVPLTIPTDALNALVIAHLKELEVNAKEKKGLSNFRIHCYMSDSLPDDVAGGDGISGVPQSGILEQVSKLTEISNKISADLSRFDGTSGLIVPDLGGAPQLPPNKELKLEVLNALLQFAERLDPAKDPKDLNSQRTQVENTFAKDLKPMDTQLKAYQASVNQLLASLYGSSVSSLAPTAPASTPSTNQVSATPPPTPSPAGTGTNSFLISSTISPTINPTVTVNASFSTNSATATTNSSSATPPSGQGSGTTSTPPLAAIVQQEALFEKLSRMPMLYLNVVSAGGANMTANGWFTSSFKYNAGVAVDFFLMDTNGEVLASSLENDQSPYLKEVPSSGGERLPTVVTTDRHATVQNDIDDLEDREPQSRFTTVPVAERAATGKTDVTPDYSGISSKPR